MLVFLYSMTAIVLQKCIHIINVTMVWGCFKVFNTKIKILSYQVYITQILRKSNDDSQLTLLAIIIITVTIASSYQKTLPGN